MAPLEPLLLVPAHLFGGAVLLVVVWAVAEISPPTVAVAIAAVAVSAVTVAVLRLSLVLGERNAEYPGCCANQRDLQGVAARRCLRQRFGEKIEPSFVHLRQSSWRLEPLPHIITGTLLAYASSTTRKRETGTSGFIILGRQA
ncbi:MAG: hypothetical protein KC442_04815 [Thermomicrobiales bacterium]|nr:hypothetical protein [Thermomicrobiales bacterium]